MYFFQCEAMEEEQQQLGFEDFRNGLGEEIDEAYGVFWRQSADLGELQQRRYERHTGRNWKEKTKLKKISDVLKGDRGKHKQYKVCPKLNLKGI